MITSEADNDKRLTRVLNWWELVWTISFIVLSYTLVKLSFLFVALYLALHAQYEKCVKKFIDNICNNSPWAWYSEMNIISSDLAPKTYKYTLSVLILETWWQLADIWARETKNL